VVFLLKHGSGFLELCNSDTTKCCIEDIAIMKMGESVDEIPLKERSSGV